MNSEAAVSLSINTPYGYCTGKRIVHAARFTRTGEERGVSEELADVNHLNQATMSAW
jgi:hypothetical protein